jgi:hypothetical protein
MFVLPKQTVVSPTPHCTGCMVGRKSLFSFQSISEPSILLLHGHLYRMTFLSSEVGTTSLMLLLDLKKTERFSIHALALFGTRC